MQYEQLAIDQSNIEARSAATAKLENKLELAQQEGSQQAKYFRHLMHYKQLMRKSILTCFI